MSTYNGPRLSNPGPGQAIIIIYTYVPSLALGIIGIVSYFIVALINAYWGWKSKGGGMRSFHVLLCVGSVSEGA